MRPWLVAGAVIEGPAGLLLVQNRRRDGRVDWSTPGGVVDEGETVLGGLTREVAEETGLRVSRWEEGPLYEIEAEAPEMGWRLRVEVHLAVRVEGDIEIDDPDGIVIGAEYVDPGRCPDLLAGSPRWVRDPLGAWIGERWAARRSFRYRVEGRRLDEIRVHALE